MAILNGDYDLIPSNNTWDWLGDGIYFWEQNPNRALEYALNSAMGIQFNKVPIKTPFVLGAILELGHCLNLVEHGALRLLSETYNEMEKVYKVAKLPMPVNKDTRRELDCAVIKYIHQTNKTEGKRNFDSVRCAFGEGLLAYPTSNFSSQLHMQVCLKTPDLIKGYFLPKPLNQFNPYLKTPFDKRAIAGF